MQPHKLVLPGEPRVNVLDHDKILLYSTASARRALWH
jgi:hypothetical protein